MKRIEGDAPSERPLSTLTHAPTISAKGSKGNSNSLVLYKIINVSFWVHIDGWIGGFVDEMFWYFFSLMLYQIIDVSFWGLYWCMDWWIGGWKFWYYLMSKHNLSVTVVGVFTKCGFRVLGWGSTVEVWRRSFQALSIQGFWVWRRVLIGSLTCMGSLPPIWPVMSALNSPSVTC